MENEDRWKHNLKWVNWETIRNLEWITIGRLPVNLLGGGGKKNFTEIASRFGLIIDPFDHIPNKIDLSCTKIGNITNRRICINEVITVASDGKLFNVGITEFDEAIWFPFWFK